MRRFSYIFLSIAAGIFLSRPGVAEVMIDFETAPNGSFLVAPVGFGNATALRDFFAPLGVRFDGPSSMDGGAVLDELSNLGIDARSGNNFVAFDNATGNLSDGGTAFGRQTLLFDTPITSFSIFASGGQNPGSFSIQGLNSNNVFVAFGQPSSTAGAYAELKLNASSVNPISQVRIQPTGLTRWFLDDLSFTPIPEPGSVVSFIVAGLLFTGRRSYRATSSD